MIISCFECGKPAKHNHHVVPKMYGGTKTIPLCLGCHHKAHRIKIAVGTLWKVGVKKAQRAGTSFGAPRKFNHQKVLDLRGKGFSYQKIANKMKASKGAVQMILKKYKLTEGYK